MQFFTQKRGVGLKDLKLNTLIIFVLKGAPARTVIDTIVNIGNGWHIAAENKGIPYDHCSMRWSGVVRPEKTANYRFIVRGFDGFRLKIGTEMLINEWRDQGITTRETVLALEAGKEYPVVLEYLLMCILLIFLLDGERIDCFLMRL